MNDKRVDKGVGYEEERKGRRDGSPCVRHCMPFHDLLRERERGRERERERETMPVHDLQRERERGRERGRERERDREGERP